MAGLWKARRNGRVPSGDVTGESGCDTSGADSAILAGWNMAQR